MNQKQHKMLSIVLILVFIMTLVPPVALAADIPTAEISMVEVDVSGEKKIYKLAGRVSADEGVRSIDTWISFDNTVIQPVRNNNYEDVTPEEAITGGNPLPFKSLIKDDYEEAYTALVGWFISEQRTGFYYMLSTANGIKKPYDGDYFEFYFRLANGKTINDLNKTTFAIENMNTAAADTARSAWTVGVGDSATPYEYFQQDIFEKGQVTNKWNPVLTYTNSDKEPALPYLEATKGPYETSEQLDFSKLTQQEVVDLQPYGIYWEGSEEDGYILALHNAKIHTSFSGSNAIILPANTTVYVIGDGNEIIYTGVGAGYCVSTDSGALTITGGGKLKIDNGNKRTYAINAGAQNCDLKIIGIELEVTNFTTGGIESAGALWIENSTIKVSSTGGSRTSTSSRAFAGIYGVTIKDSEVTVMVANQYYGLYAGADGDGIKIESSTVDINGQIGTTSTRNYMQAYAIMALGKGVNIVDSDIAIEVPADAGRSIATQNSGADINVSGSSVITLNNLKGFGFEAQAADANINIDGTVKIDNPNAGSIVFNREPLGQTGITIEAEQAVEIITDYNINPGTYSWNGAWENALTAVPIPVGSGAGKTYDQTINGSSASNAFKLDNTTLAEYGIHWNHLTKTLTLNNATIKSGSVNVINLLEDSVLNLIGENKVVYTGTTGDCVKLEGKEIRGDFRAGSRPKLSIESTKNGIIHSKMMTLKDCYVDVKTSDGIGMYSTGSLALENAYVKIDSPNTAIEQLSYLLKNSTIELVKGNLIYKSGTNSYTSDLASNVIVRTDNTTLLSESVTADRYKYVNQKFITASEAGDGASYVMSLSLAEETGNFTEGKEFEVDISISAKAINSILGSFDFTLDYDKDYFELKSLTSNASGNAQINEDAIAFTVYGHGLIIGTEPIKIATATFIVKNGITPKPQIITIKNEKTTHQGTDTHEEPGVNPLEVPADEFTLEVGNEGGIQVTYETGSPINGKIKYGADIKFTLGESIVMSVTYSVNGGNAKTITAENGKYTIPGSEIKGPVKLTIKSLQAGMSFIKSTEYFALGENTKLVLLSAAFETNQKFTLTSGGEFYWSDKYNAYVCIVADSETVETISAKLQKTTGNTVSINYSGDINGDGLITSTDAMIINDILHDKRVSTSDIYRLKADVSGNKEVTTQDIVWILRVAVGLPGEAQ